METHFHLFVCVLLVILACESMVLCTCSGKYIDIYFSLKITYWYLYKDFSKDVFLDWEVP